MNSFKNAETQIYFAYCARRPEDWDDGSCADYPHVVFMSDDTTRFAKVKKTVAHVVVDADEYGQPVTERWQIRDHECETVVQYFSTHQAH